MENTRKLKQMSLDQLKDKHIGKIGTTARDKYESDLVNDIMTRTERQEIIVKKWKKKKDGILIAATGFGKTRVGINCIKSFSKAPKTLVVVPTIVLKEQWEGIIKKEKLDRVKVLVINTAAKVKLDVDFLICDEMHRYAAPVFRELFSNISYKYFLGLTATIERHDGEEKFLLSKSSIFDTVSLNECLDNNWVSDFITYNLGVSFTNSERGKYEDINNKFKWAASHCGFGGQSFKNAQQWLKTGNKEQKKFAGIYFNMMRMRKKLCNEAVNKIFTTIELIKKFDKRKTLVFGETVSFADEIQNELGDISVVFHSNIKKSEQKDALKVFKDNRTKKRVIVSCKALDQGLDVPECSLGIVVSGNSRKLTNIQRTGRIIRAIPGKRAIFVNIYARDSQDFNWVKKRTEDQAVQWISSIDEIED